MGKNKTLDAHVVHDKSERTYSDDQSMPLHALMQPSPVKQSPKKKVVKLHKSKSKSRNKNASSPSYSELPYYNQDSYTQPLAAAGSPPPVPRTKTNKPLNDSQLHQLSLQHASTAAFALTSGNVANPYMDPDLAIAQQDMDLGKSLKVKGDYRGAVHECKRQWTCASGL